MTNASTFCFSLFHRSVVFIVTMAADLISVLKALSFVSLHTLVYLLTVVGTSFVQIESVFQFIKKTPLLESRCFHPLNTYLL